MSYAFPPISSRLRDLWKILSPVCAIVLLIFAVILLLMPSRYFTIPLVVSCSIFLSLAVSKREERVAKESTQLSPLHETTWKNDNVLMRFTALFGVVMFLSLVDWVFRPDQYERPLLFFVLVALACAVIAAQCAYTHGRRRGGAVILSEVVLIGIWLRVSAMFLFPGLMKYDSWWHMTFTSKIISSGSVPTDTVYSGLPIMHILTAETELVASMGYSNSVFMAVSITECIIVPLSIYWIVKRLNARSEVALMSALIVSVADRAILWGISAFPTLLGVSFIVLFIMIALSRNTGSTLSRSLAMIAVALAIAVTHPIASLCLIMTLSILVIGKVTVQHKTQKALSSLPLLTGFAILLMTMISLAVWSIMSTHLSIFIDYLLAGFRPELLGRVPTDLVTAYMSGISLQEYQLSIMGLTLFLGLCVYGWSNYFLTRQMSTGILIWSVAGFLLAGITFIAMLSQSKIIVDRWWLFTDLMIAPLAAIALLGGISYSKPESQRDKSNFRKRVAASVMLTLMLSFFMISSPVANVDNSSITPNLTIRYAFTHSELEGLNQICLLTDETIGSDQQAVVYLVWGLNASALMATEDIANCRFDDLTDCMIVIRDEIRVNPFNSDGVLRLIQDPVLCLDANADYARVYDNGAITAYSN